MGRQLTFRERHRRIVRSPQCDGVSVRGVVGCRWMAWSCSAVMRSRTTAEVAPVSVRLDRWRCGVASGGSARRRSRRGLGGCAGCRAARAIAGAPSSRMTCSSTWWRTDQRRSSQGTQKRVPQSWTTSGAGSASRYGYVRIEGDEPKAATAGRAATAGGAGSGCGPVRSPAREPHRGCVSVVFRCRWCRTDDAAACFSQARDPGQQHDRVPRVVQLRDRVSPQVL